MDRKTVFAGWEYVIEETSHGPEYKKLGAGGFGSVFEIKKEGSLDFRSAMKIISIPKNEGEIKQYIADGNNEKQIQQILEDRKAGAIGEVNLLVQLRYKPNIVGIEDYAIKEKDEGIGWDLYIRMELLASIDELEIAIRKGEAEPFQEEEVRRLGTDICTALEECHSSGLLHRDIKPSNIFIDEDGRYKLGDFGISRVLDETTGIISTSKTDWYAAPEVMRFEKGRVTADIYSLGLVMYELLNQGKLPFMPPASQKLRPNDRALALARRVRGEQIEPIEGVSDQINDIVLKACSFDPKDRFASAKEMKERLTQTAAKREPAAENKPQEIRITGKYGRNITFTKNAIAIDGEEFLYTEIETIMHSPTKNAYLFRCNGTWHPIVYEEKDAEILKRIISKIARINAKRREIQEKENIEKTAREEDVTVYERKASGGVKTVSPLTDKMQRMQGKLKLLFGKDDAPAARLYHTPVKISDEWDAPSYEDGDAYYYGINREKDYEKALACYEKAAENQDAKAFFMLGKIYEEGNGVAKNYAEALNWYTKAADAGNQYAQVRLGKMYETGKGIRQSYEAAASWYQKAANQGNANAKWHLQKIKAKAGDYSS